MPRDDAILKTAGLFQGLDAQALEQAQLLSRRVSRKDEAFFFMEGDPATHTLILAEGRVKLSQVSPDGQQVLMGYIGPGREFGIISAVRKIEYPVSAQAVGDSAALSWGREQIAGLIDRYPLIRDNAMQIMARQIGEFQSRIRELSTQRVERRVARTLLRLAQQSGVKTKEGVLINLPLSRQDLGEMTGATVFTVSRILKQWEQQGLVISGREKVIIAHPHGLVRIAEDFPDNSGE